MTPSQFLRSAGRPAAATNLGAFLAERARDIGRKRLCTPADPSVRNVFPVARGFVLSLLRTRRDAIPPGSGGLFLSLSSSLSLRFVPPLTWRGCG